MHPGAPATPAQTFTGSRKGGGRTIVTNVDPAAKVLQDDEPGSGRCTARACLTRTGPSATRAQPQRGTLTGDIMDKPDAPQPASPEEEARIGETPAVFANKVYVSPLPGGARITFAEARRVSGEDRASPRVAVFLQHADLAALRRLLDWTASAAGTPPERIGGSVH